MMVGYTMRACLSVAITEMVVPQNNTSKGNGSLICSIDEPLSVETSHQMKTVNHSTLVDYVLFLLFLKYIKKACDIQ